MNDWVNLHALWRIVVVGVICGAGLPALFAVGLKALAFGSSGEPAVAGAGDGGGSTQTALRPSPLGIAAAAVCFTVILAAIAWGIYLVVNG